MLTTNTAGYSLTRRVLIKTGLVLLISSLVLILVVWRNAVETADFSYDRLLTGAVLSIQERVTTTKGEVEIDIPSAAFNILSLAPNDKVFYKITGPDDLWLTGYEQFPSRPSSGPSNELFFYDSQFLGDAIRVAGVTKLLDLNGENYEVRIFVGQTREARNEMMRDIIFRELIVFAIVVAFALASLTYGITQTFKPLRSISRLFATRSSSDLSPLPTSQIREIQPLVTSIDQYRVKLYSNVERMKRFIADASHQIRTSLSSMGAQLEIAQLENDPQRIRDRLVSISNQHARMTRLTNQLLTDALIAHRADTDQQSQTHLDELMQQILTDLARDHAHTEIEFEYFNDQRNLVMTVDPVGLKEAITNLIDNAVCYGPADNRITLALEDAGAHIGISVSDSGPGIPESEMQRVTERFERLDRSSGSVGSGLGLAIAQSVTQTHGGLLKLENLAVRGLKATLLISKERLC